ncbi:hypothetical protein QR680_010784 [Steinernema hermaphroditum]|uniref:Aminopeptidase n=1 Tax=Steinernema hermaphroditum TaxID=289476 RepID=A0AA39MC95_9BILA|nr:hypothetical protein QR680_010784 [Steinernema hermaphroditum]
MPTPTTVKLLFEESQPEDDDVGNWTVKSVRPNGKHRLVRASRACLVTLMVALTMLILGTLLGAILLPHTFGQCDVKNKSEAVVEPPIQEQIVAECGESYPWRRIRLPEDVEPTNYKLVLQPNLTTLELSGTVTIDLKVITKTKLVVLHAQKLNITSFSFQVEGKRIDAEHFICDRVNQWAFLLSRTISRGDDVRLLIDYEGSIQKDLTGLYLNTHIQTDNSKTYSAVTQFEPTLARKAYPCFDEPKFKAVFDVSVIREMRHVVRANMHLIRSEEYGNDLVMDQFAPSVKMSTYITALAVLDGFKVVRRTTTKTKKPVEVSLYAAGDSIRNQSDFGLNTGIRALEYFEKFFDIPFPLQKTDLIALDDFSEGAMENWGMVTFRDAMLLYNEARSTEKSREVVALVVCHEIAHQWFGNYVTMKWWSDLWLNEGFANYMEYLCADDLYPEWNVLNDFYVENFVQSMLLDGFSSSHAVSNDVEDPAQIGSMFDVISYQKGASLIQMLRGLAGKDAFQIALQEYLKKYAYANAERIDLWNIIQKHVTLSDDISVADVAEAWTSQIGYPLISVGLDRGSMVVRNQTKFLLLEDERAADNSNTKWPIPIQYRSDLADQVNLIWLKADQESAIQRIGQNVKWVVANTGSLGYYRVLYEKDIYKQLIKQLSTDHEKLSAVDRATILNDAFFFAKSGHLGIETALDLVKYVESNTEIERIPWVVIITHLKVIEQMISETPIVDLFQKFEKSIFMKAYERLGWKRPEKHVDRMLQTEVLAMACRLQIADCSKQAQNLFNKWLQDKNSVFVDIQPFVIEEGVRRGSTSDWERVYDEYLKTTNPSQKLMLLNALASTKNVRLVHRFMLMCLDPAVVRPNILPRALGMLMQNRVAALYAWRFFRMNYDKFDKIIGGTTTMLGMMSKSIIENFNTEYDLLEVREFFKGKKMGASRARVDQAIESIVLNVQWRRLNEKALERWVRKWDSKRTLYRS